ncbi:MAG: hypothetical protein AAFR79_14495 [Pseudomonadota bacterium]
MVRIAHTSIGSKAFPCPLDLSDVNPAARNAVASGSFAFAELTHLSVRDLVGVISPANLGERVKATTRAETTLKDSSAARAANPTFCPKPFSGALDGADLNPTAADIVAPSRLALAELPHLAIGGPLVGGLITPASEVRNADETSSWPKAALKELIPPTAEGTSLSYIPSSNGLDTTHFDRSPPHVVAQCSLFFADRAHLAVGGDSAFANTIASTDWPTLNRWTNILVASC